MAWDKPFVYAHFGFNGFHRRDSTTDSCLDLRCLGGSGIGADFAEFVLSAVTWKLVSNTIKKINKYKKLKFILIAEKRLSN